MRPERERDSCTLDCSLLALLWYCPKQDQVKTMLRDHQGILKRKQISRNYLYFCISSKLGPHSLLLLEVLSAFAFPQTTDNPAANAVQKSRMQCLAHRMLIGS